MYARERVELKILVAHDVSATIDSSEPKTKQDIVFTELDIERVLREQGHIVARAAIANDVWRALEPYDPNEWLIFNLCEQLNGKTSLEPYVTAVYEHLGFRYTGANRPTLLNSLHKARTKEILLAHSLPTANFQIFQPDTKIERRLNFPLFVKPASEDASIGITLKSVVHDERALREQVRRIWEKYKQAALVEEFIEGREFNVTLLGNESPRVLPLSEIDFQRLADPYARIVSFRGKWVSDSPEYILTEPQCPARVTPTLKARIEDVAWRAYKTMGLRDYGRVDLRVRDGQPYILEVNPNADISHNAGIARAARVAGLSYAELIDEVVRLAASRTRFNRALRPRLVQYQLRVASAHRLAIPRGALLPPPALKPAPLALATKSVSPALKAIS